MNFLKCNLKANKNMSILKRVSSRYVYFIVNNNYDKKNFLKNKALAKFYLTMKQQIDLFIK